MSKKITAICSISCLAVMFAFAAHLAMAAKSKAEADVIPSKGKAVVRIPEKAVEVTPGVFSLGTAIHNGEIVEGYAFYGYKDNSAKSCGNGICDSGETANKCPQNCSGNKSSKIGTGSCYGFLASGAKWKTIEPYVVNPANTEGLDGVFITNNLATDISKWETAAGAGVNILGDGSATDETLEADLIQPDNKNEVYFGSIEQPGAIAITIVWGVFGGPIKSRRLVEWDQVYDQVDFNWSASGEAGKMDFENIATHELGHSVGMGDLYTSQCSAMTMYGYAGYGETMKRTLENGDINGVRILY